MSMLVRGGRVVTADEGVVADVLVVGETIARVGASIDADADRVIDATGCYVLPGMVDPHTHLETPAGSTVTVDDFTSGSIAAAFGGTTTLVHFCVPAGGEDFDDTLASWHERLEIRAPVVDVGFHMFVTDLGGDRSPEQLALLPDQGVTTFKVFMSYKHDLMIGDAALFETMRVAARTGALVMVHAENGDVIDLLQRDALAAGHTEPRWHARTRPPGTEAEATNRAIELAHLAGAPLYVAHVSCQEALEPVIRARARGWDVTAETCTHYLLVDDGAIEQDGWEAAGFVYTPPPRPGHNREVLWQALADDSLSVISSDHNAFTLGEQKALGRDDFTRIPNGAPGIEDRLRLVHQFGVRSGRISLCRMVDLLATSPARRFGLYPRKGTIAAGGDADLVVFDPERRVTISAAGQRSRSDYNLYEGTEVTGSPAVVILRGQVIVADDELVASPGAGRFIRRARAGAALEPRGEQVRGG
jgi:dihydropyrimidinase